MMENFWECACVVCGVYYLGDGEPCCNDPVCQSEYWGEFEHGMAITEAQDLLDSAYFDLMCQAVGL